MSAERYKQDARLAAARAAELRQQRDALVIERDELASQLRLASQRLTGQEQRIAHLQAALQKIRGVA